MTRQNDWVSDTPRCDVLSGQIVPSLADIDETVLPCLSLRFVDGRGEPVTLTLVGLERDLRKFQMAIDRAITQAVRGSKAGIADKARQKPTE